MSKTYIEQLANLMQMLQNLDRDLNLVAFNETEKKNILHHCLSSS